MIKLVPKGLGNMDQFMNKLLLQGIARHIELNE